MAKNEIADQVDRVRSVAKPALARFAKSSVDRCTESYLFSSDRFCGLRIRLEAFEAVWRMGAMTVEISRGGHILQTLPIAPNNQQRSAA